MSRSWNIGGGSSSKLPASTLILISDHLEIGTESRLQKPAGKHAFLFFSEETSLSCVVLLYGRDRIIALTNFSSSVYIMATITTDRLSTDKDIVETATEAGMARDEQIVMEGVHSQEKRSLRQKILRVLWDSLDKSPEERKFVNKADWWIMSYVCVAYFVKYLDQTNVRHTI